MRQEDCYESLNYESNLLQILTSVFHELKFEKRKKINEATLGIWKIIRLFNWSRIVFDFVAHSIATGIWHTSG